MLNHNFISIVDSLTVPTFVIDIEHKVVAWNKACELLTGIKASDIMGKPDSWRGFYSSKRPCLADVVVDKTLDTLNTLYPLHGESKFSSGLHAENWFNSINGKKRYLIFDAEPLYDDDGTLIGALENLEDITDIKLAELQGRIQSQVLSQLVDGASLTVIFNSLLEEVEKEDPLISCSIQLLDTSSDRLVVASAPKLLDFQKQTMGKMPIGNDVGGCGTAVYTLKRVVVDNIQKQLFWEPYKELAAKESLVSCWSEPIIGKNNEPLGSFAIYHKEAKIPLANRAIGLKSA